MIDFETRAGFMLNVPRKVEQPLCCTGKNWTLKIPYWRLYSNLVVADRRSATTRLEYNLQYNQVLSLLLSITD
jgi:hypothetical protein